MEYVQEHYETHNLPPLRGCSALDATEVDHCKLNRWEAYMYLIEDINRGLIYPMLTISRIGEVRLVFSKGDKNEEV